MVQSPLITRFAPTPSGFLHQGNGVSFIVTWVLARARKGQIVLRIDDLDAARMRRPYVADIFETLDWLQLDYDRGPLSTTDFLAHFSQHKRLNLYEQALQSLQASAKIYACTCSRKQIQAQQTDGRYPRTCRLRQLPFDQPETAWRFAATPLSDFCIKTGLLDEKTVLTALEIEDIVVRQKNGLPAYQLASIVDDVHFGVNFIVRGQDLWSSTVAQCVLARHIDATAWATDTTFWHHPLLTDAVGKKLSKSEGAMALRHMRHDGLRPAALYGMAAQWLGLPVPHRFATAAELLDAYGTFLG